jgi:hypothetical protein
MWSRQIAGICGETAAGRRGWCWLAALADVRQKEEETVDRLINTPCPVQEGLPPAGASVVSAGALPVIRQNQQFFYKLTVMIMVVVSCCFTIFHILFERLGAGDA